MSLKTRWCQLIATFDLDFSQAEQQFTDITNAHSEKHRVYHNLSHLTHFFAQLDDIPEIAPEVLFAVWYHDFVYKTGSKNNEHKSANIAVAALKQLKIDNAIGQRVAELIEATKSHQATSEHLNENPQMGYFLDVDMSILGSEPQAYQQYTAAIRQEHRRFPDFLYKPGRKKFLKHTLASEHIFVTPWFQQRYEAQARRNLQAELLTL
jgi:predicted metal-dependent HD superfamily phosphohydrolase